MEEKKLSKKERLLKISEATGNMQANISVKANSPVTRGEWVPFTSSLLPHVKKRLTYICALNEVKIKDVLNDIVENYTKDYDEYGHKIDKKAKV